MAVFAVYEHPSKAPDRTVFVKEGFAFWALVLPVLWALWHRMWVTAAVLVAVYGVIHLAVSLFALSDINAALLDMAVNIIFAMEARNLRIASLRRAGYREQALVMASSLYEAELKHAFEICKPRPHEPLSVRIRPQAADTLGLFGSA